MENLIIDWNDIMRNHQCSDGKNTIDITILDIDAVKREVTISATQNGITKRDTIKLYVDEIGFLYICYPYSYSEEIYIEESYL